jgi:hypothetical protein
MDTNKHEGCCGVRASARFNVHGGATLEVSGVSSIRALKRRERRAPPILNSSALISIRGFHFILCTWI